MIIIIVWKILLANSVLKDIKKQKKKLVNKKLKTHQRKVSLNMRKEKVGAKRKEETRKNN